MDSQTPQNQNNPLIDTDQQVCEWVVDKAFDRVLGERPLGPGLLGQSPLGHGLLGQRPLGQSLLGQSLIGRIPRVSEEILVCKCNYQQVRNLQ